MNRREFMQTLAIRRLARIERARREMDAGNYYTKEQVDAMLKADGLLP